jgi:hypothetical protein
MKATLLAAALSASPVLLLPPWPLSPDGDLVAVRGDAALAASGAAVERVAPGLWRVVPDPGASSVVFSAAGATASAPVEPPPGVVTIAASPPAPVKGRDATMDLELAVTRADGSADEGAPLPVVVASVGRVRDVRAVGSGRFRAVFEPASTRHPDVAVLLALAPRCPLCPTPRAVGHAVVPLAAAIELPGHSEPGARTTVELGGRTFGPVAADARGRFAVPVIVPPGARTATAVSVDRVGNRRTTELDLGLPEPDRLACAAWPPVVPADGRAEAVIWCAAATPHGAPAPDARLELSASAGTVAPAAPVRGALQRATFRAPRGGGGREALVTARLSSARTASGEAVSIGLATGAPAEVVVSLEREPVPAGAAVAAAATVRDARGDAVGRARGPAGATEGLVAPDRFVARRTPGDLAQPVALSFALEPGADVATLTLRRDGAEWVATARTADARPAAGVALRFGAGALATTDARGEARAPAASPAGSVAAANGARAAGWEGVAPPPAPFELARTVAVALRPPVAVDVVARVEGGALRWRIEDAAGRPLPGRDVTLRPRGVDLGPAERDGDGGRAVVRGGRGLVAVVDEATGVGAVVEVP